jgi:hypothetical protein
VTDLWRSTRSILRFDAAEDFEPVLGVLNSLGGVVTNLGGVRNALSDAHGRGVDPPVVSQATAELALNTAMALSTMLVRRYIEMQEGGDGND